MGWLFKSGISRRDLIVDNTRGWERTHEDGTLIKSGCLAHCYRGGIFSGVLWSAWERTFTKDGQQVEPSQRWIVCDLLRYVQGEWATPLSISRRLFCPEGANQDSLGQRPRKTMILRNQP